MPDELLKRIPTNFTLITGLDMLTAEDLVQLELMAKTLTFEDSLIALFLSNDELSEYELDIAKRVHARGRQLAIKEAGENLFAQMKQRGGTDACLQYLKQMSGSFVVQVTPGSPNGTNSGFSFNIYPPGAPPPPSPAPADSQQNAPGPASHSSHLSLVDSVNDGD